MEFINHNNQQVPQNYRTFSAKKPIDFTEMRSITKVAQKCETVSV